MSFIIVWNVVGLLVMFKKHHQRFKETIVSAKCSLPLILWLDVDIVELPAYVQFCKIPGILELGD